MSKKLPPIVMTAHEHARLSDLAAIISARHPDFGDDLMRELERAEVVPPKQVGPATVTMGSQVEFAYRDSGIRQTVTLVFPSDADIAKGKVSILTPVGTALIGLSEGQSIVFWTPRGEERTIVVLKVRRPGITAGEKAPDKGTGAAPGGAKVIPIGARVGRAGSRRPVGRAEPIGETDSDDPGPSAA